MIMEEGFQPRDDGTEMRGISRSRLPSRSASARPARRAGRRRALPEALAIKGHRGRSGPTVGDLAGYLLRRHHSTVELIDRAEAAGLVERWGDDEDGRVTRIRLTADGERRLGRLAAAHLDELQQLAPALDQLVARWNKPDQA